MKAARDHGTHRRLAAGCLVVPTLTLALWIIARVFTDGPDAPRRCPVRVPTRSHEVDDYTGLIRSADVVFVGKVSSARIRPWPFTPEAWRTAANRRLLALYSVDVLATVKGEADGTVRVEQPENLPIHCPNDFPNDTLAPGQTALFSTIRIGDVFSLQWGASAHVPLPATVDAHDVVATVTHLLGSEAAPPTTVA